MKKLTAAKALELLQPIPEDEFLTTVYTDGVSKCCAIGHLVRLLSNDPNNYNAPNCYDAPINNSHKYVVFDFRAYSNKFLTSLGHNALNIASINNAIIDDLAPEPTIKERVINFLTKMVKWEESN